MMQLYRFKLTILLSASLLSACSQTMPVDAAIVGQRVEHMYAMRAIGVELVDMYEAKKIDGARVTELSKQLTAQSRSLPALFPAGSSSADFKASNALPVIWDDSIAFQAAITHFQAKSAALNHFILQKGAEQAWPKSRRRGTRAQLVVLNSAKAAIRLMNRKALQIFAANYGIETDQSQWRL
jgi:cytochrome c556